MATLNTQTGITTVANHRVYDSFGNLKSQTNAAVDCLFGFTGRPTDNDTGLRNHLNRWTDPQTAGWLSKDPLGFMAGDTNTVRYVGNRVTSLTDPTGLQRWNSQEVVSLLDQISPTLGAFWQRYGKVVGGAQQRSTFGRMFHWFDAPSVKVTRWYDNGTYVNPAVYPGLAEEVTAKVPDDWTSIQVAMYIAGQVAGNQSLQGALASRCVSGFDLEMQSVARVAPNYQQCCNQIAALMTAGTEVGVCMLPGGTFMLSVHQAFEGHYFAAAIGIVAILPWGKLAAAIKFADGEINLSKPVVEALQWMTPAERAALDARVAGNMTITEGEKILANLSNGALREVGTLRPVEQVTAGRLQGLLGSSLKDLTPGPPGELDLYGIYKGTRSSFELIGAPGASANWVRQEQQFLRQITEHLWRKPDYLVIDLTGFTAKQIASVQKYIRDTVSAADRAKIIPIGFSLL